MKSVLVQVAKSYLCLTACEAVREQETKDNKKAVPDAVYPYSFTSPLIVEIEKEDLGDKNTIWEDPKLFATLVKSGLEQMNHNEVTEVILAVDSYDLTCHEYQHIKTTPKILNSLAIEQIREFVGDAVDNFSVIYKDYVPTKSQTGETTAKAFAFPKPLINDLAHAFGGAGLTLVKVMPTEAALIYTAQNSVYSFDKTVAFVSMDYTSVRVFIARNGAPLYCHDFHSPIEDILHIIAEDRGISIGSAVDYLRTVGYGLSADFRDERSALKLDAVKENIVDDIVRNIRLVLMSLNITIDQMYLSDFLAFIPHIRNYFVTFGFTPNVELISDSFTPSTIAPEPSLQARDDFYKSGSFFLMNDLMNSGNQYNDNLIYGLKAAVAKNVNFGKKLSNIGIIVLCALIGLGGVGYGFLNIRKGIDNGNLADTKYDTAKSLIEKQTTITTNIQNQASDAEMLPRTKFYTEDVINQMNAQIVKKLTKFSGYSITHQISETGTEECVAPISGSINSFDAFIALQDSLKEDGFFIMSPSFNISESTENSGYDFSIQVTSSELTQALNETADNQKTAN